MHKIKRARGAQRYRMADRDVILSCVPGETVPPWRTQDCFVHSEQ